MTHTLARYKSKVGAMTSVVNLSHVLAKRCVGLLTYMEIHGFGRGKYGAELVSDYDLMIGSLTFSWPDFWQVCSCQKFNCSIPDSDTCRNETCKPRNMTTSTDAQNKARRKFVVRLGQLDYRL
jgi:hypothetical protein